MADGPAGFAQDSTCPALLRIPLGLGAVSRTGVSPSPPGLSRPLRYRAFVRLAVLQPPSGLDRPGLGYSGLARRYPRNHCCSLLLGVLRCFSSPRSPRRLATAVVPPPGPGCPIRTPAGQSLPAADRGFSQLAASFVASMSLGIHRSPFTRFPRRRIRRRTDSSFVSLVFQTCQKPPSPPSFDRGK